MKSFFSPIKPDLMNWNSLYPLHFSNNEQESREINSLQECVEFADIGCGYGGLLGIYSLSLNIILVFEIITKYFTK